MFLFSQVQTSAEAEPLSGCKGGGPGWWALAMARGPSPRVEAGFGACLCPCSHGRASEGLGL